MSKNKDKKLLEKYMINGGCEISPDDDRDYTVKTVALAAIPLPEEYRIDGMKVLNQGSIGSCVAHACATSMGYGELASGEDVAHDFSRGYIYGNRQAKDYQGEGMYIRQALRQLNHYGDCEYNDFPYNETYPKVKARIDANAEELATKAEPFKIINYFRCYTNDEVKMAIMNQGAVIISIPVYSTFTGNCPLPEKDDEYRGNHAMCVVGWDKKGWIIQNSWSKFWGKKGYLYLPYDYPTNEFWGVTVNPNVPKPKKTSIFTRIAYYFTKLIDCLKKLFKKK